MPYTLHSLSVYEEIVIHTSLQMMTKLTDALKPATDYWSGTKERSEAFRKAWISATEATLVDRKESELLPPGFD
tara:strand:- start:70 stop:291 length:222 start_codon:yes stop_codon:yes gene_type:complete